MLRHIAPCLSPELVKILMEMGHADEIVIADANFPRFALQNTVVRADGLMIPDILKGILNLMPLDRYNDYQAALMITIGDDPTPPAWAVYKDILNEAEKEVGEVTVKHFERYEFYDIAKKAAAVVITGDTALYGNIVLRKGVL